MAQRNFTQFELRQIPLTGDFLVGYKNNATAEIRTNFQNIINLIYSSNPTGYQGFSLVRQNSGTTWNYQGTDLKQLSGNWQNTYLTVLNNAGTTWNYQGTDLKQLSSNWNEATTYIQTNSTYFEQSLQAASNTTNTVTSSSNNWNTAYSIANVYQTNSAYYLTSLTVIESLTSQLVLNTDFNSYKTNVASATASNEVYVNTNFLPLTGGTLTGNLSVLGNITYIDTAVQVTSSMFIETNSTETALRVTQTGTGDVIRVEDSANPDSTPFIVKSDGLVGIGTYSPNSALTVVGTVSTSNHGTSEQWNSVYSTVASNSAFNIVTQGNARGANISIGTNDAYHLRLKTNSSAKFTVLSSGEVGVGTTLAQTKPNSQLPEIKNGSFSNVTGMTPISQINPDWFGGTVPNWSGPTDSTYTVYFNGVKYYRNIGIPSNGPQNPIKQSLGLLPIKSNVIANFNNGTNAFGVQTLSAAIFTDTLVSLASGIFDGLGTYSLSAFSVPAGTNVLIGFWGTAGITDISLVANNLDSYLTVQGGVSATYVSTPRLVVENGYVVFKNLPTNSTGLPSGALWIDGGVLSIVS